MFAVTATKVEDLHVDGMCSSSTSSSNTSEAAAEVEDERGGGMGSSCTSRAHTSAAMHVKDVRAVENLCAMDVRAAENLCAMASARTFCDDKVHCFKLLPGLGEVTGPLGQCFGQAPRNTDRTQLPTTVFANSAKKCHRTPLYPSVPEERLQGQTKKQINSHPQDLEHSLRILRTHVHRDLLEEGS